MAVYFALLGAEVVGVDANAESLAEAKRVIEAYGVADRVNLVQMDLHSLGFADQSFNVVFTKSTLIMTDPIRVVEGLRRLLKPGGRAIFLENLLGHRIMQLARRRRGDWVRRAKWLTMEDVEKICAMFPRAAHKEFHLLSASYHWLRKLLPNQRLLEFLMYIDDRLLRWVPAWREKCYITAIVAYT
jgi:ubiquinone/menaquinone biosynthesis C-methylase UbiE